MRPFAGNVFDAVQQQQQFQIIVKFKCQTQKDSARLVDFLYLIFGS